MREARIAPNVAFRVFVIALVSAANGVCTIVYERRLCRGFALVAYAFRPSSFQLIREMHYGVSSREFCGLT